MERPATAPLASITSIRASTAPSQNVRVVTRIRPLSPKEISEQSQECISSTSAVINVLNEDKHFEFDSVFGPLATQEEVYKGTAGSMIQDSIYKGFNGTILAYGQTGSGKTFTMGTDGTTTNNSSTPTPSDGVIARAVHDLFRIRQSLPSGPDRVKVEMSYLEIYNEQAIDLLSDDPSSSVLQVRDSKTEGVIVQNLKSFTVSSPREVSALMERASSKRATGSTQMNSVSSRSHAICTLNVTIAPLENNGEEEENHSSEMMKAKLTLVDLAGSERIKRTGAEGARMKEGININKGLFVLGQVVSALSEWGQQGGSKKSNAHIPYRDSKLTRLLQDSLGGNSRTVMIACISPAQSNAEETINTLRYAERTRNIKNSAVRNLVSGGLSSAEAAALRKENQQLKLELAQLRDGSVSASGSMRSLPSLGNTEVVTKLRAQCSSFLAENDLLKERIKSHSEEVLEASLRADKWQAKFERAVEMAEQHGVDLSDKIDIGDAESIVNQLRNQLSEAKTELLEARADAAMARATAGAVIAGKGDLESMSENLSVEMPALEEDESSDRDNITNELSAVSGTIEQKEAMLGQMLKERSCRETIQIHLQNSLRMLQTEVEDLTTEKSQLMLQMNQNMEDSSRRKCKTEVNPVTKRLREQIKSLESRINELKQKASEHQKSIRMKEEAEKKCARLTAEIAQDKRRRADLQKKLKEASNEIRAEKKAAQQNAARMMRDSQKLKIELHKIKSAAEKQAVVLKRKIDEAAAKEKARVELENKRKHVESMRLASASGDEIKESRKQELEAWIDREIECSRIKAQINDHQSQLESAMAERKRLMKSNSDTVDILQLENIEDDCNAIRAAISDLEDTAKKAFPAYENSNPAWRFIDSNLFKALSKHEAKHVMTYVFDMCSSVKHELDSVVADQEYKINLEIDAAVAKERQLHERDIMKLKMKHGEATLNLLESTQGAVSSNIKEMLASSGDEQAKIQFESTLNTYMKHCMSTEKRFKSDLEEMTSAAEGIEKMMEDVTQGISFVPATARRPKRFASYESEEELDMMDESFEEVGDEDDEDYRPTPKPEKKRKAKTTKRQQTVDTSPLMGESILDEDVLSNLTVSKLKEECKKHRISSSGRKCELQERLKAKLSSLPKQVIFEEDPSDIAADNDASFDEKPVAEPKQLFDENEEPSETQSAVELKFKSTADFYTSLLTAPSAKKSSSAGQPPIRPSTAPQTPSKMLGKSPKRKRESDDAVKTPGASAKKFRPLGFLSSSPRTSSPPAAAVPLGNHNRTPIMFKHTASSRKRIIAKRPPTASEQKKTKRGMNDAVNRALEICNMNNEGSGQN